MKCKGVKCNGREAEYFIRDPVGKEGTLSCRACAMWFFDQMLSEVKRDGTYMSIEVYPAAAVEKAIEKHSFMSAVESKRRPPNESR